MVVPDTSSFTSKNQFSTCTINNGWSIPKADILGNLNVNKGVPPINDPKFSSVEASKSLLLDDELVIIIKSGEEVKIYPHRILDYHEVVNDWLGGEPITLSFCPLAGTAMCWNRTIDNQITEFAASGLLFNANLVLFDTNTSSRWSQILGTSINGQLICQTLDFVTLLEATWSVASASYPQAKVLNTVTGFSFNYNQSPISFNQPAEADPLIPASKEDFRVPNFERVHIVEINGEQRAYRFTEFANGISLIVDNIANTRFLVIGDRQNQYFVSFKVKKSVDYQVIGDGRNERVILDSKGNTINFFGEIIAGPDIGTKLESLQSYTGYWYSVSAFTSSLEIYSGSKLGG
jgi:Protein of unknown function (DUF3179)